MSAKREGTKAVTKVNPVTGKTETHYVKLKFEGNKYSARFSTKRGIVGGYTLDGFYSD